MMTEAERSEFRRRMEAQNEADRSEFRRRIDAPTSSFHPAGSDSGPCDTFGIEAQARAEWQRSPAIRAEFGELERYIAFVKADAKGLIKILSRSRNA